MKEIPTSCKALENATVMCDVCGSQSSVPYEQYWAFSLSGGRCNNCGKKMIGKKSTKNNNGQYDNTSVVNKESNFKPRGINSDVGDGFL